MIRTLTTILCPVHQKYEKDMSLGPPETGSTEHPGVVCGDKAGRKFRALCREHQG